MSQEVVCSICSREKKQDVGLIPARQRYLGTHISLVEGKAARRNLSFFILSGARGRHRAEPAHTCAKCS